jgi:hypothetical protein
LKKGGWITHLSGRILKPSLHESFVEKYTDSLEDIHANHFRQQGSDKEKKTQDTYGHTSSSTSGQLDLFGAFGKMSQDTPRWGYGESCPIWKKKVIDARGVYSVRKKLARHTKGNESSSWGTPKEQDSRAASWDRGKSNLGEQVHGMAKSWATPQASDHIEGARTAKESNQKCLGRDLNQMNWATPVAMNDGIYVDNSPNKDKRHSQGLATQASQNWPTPTAMSRPRSEETMEKCLKFRKSKGKNSVPLYLEEKVRKEQHAGPPAQEKSNTSGKNQGSWLTPKSRDYRDVENHILRTGENVRKTGQKFSVGLPTQAHMKEFPEAKKAQAKLNPSWVEQLMGLSTGWTDLGSWGMELSPKQQN